jgi:hypothetical protein
MYTVDAQQNSEQMALEVLNKLFLYAGVTLLRGQKGHGANISSKLLLKASHADFQLQYIFTRRVLEITLGKDNAASYIQAFAERIKENPGPWNNFSRSLGESIANSSISLKKILEMMSENTCKNF